MRSFFLAAIVLTVLLSSSPSALALEAKEAAAPNGFELVSLQVAREKIIGGGPPRDGIRSVDRPEFAPLPEATWVGPRTPVLGVVLKGEAHAYPVHLIEYHQIVNDVIAGVPIVVSYDPLAGCPLAFRRKLDGRTLSFGVSGLLYNSNFLLYDRETESLWSQVLGRALAGSLAGKTLERVRVRQEALIWWLERHPNSRVLVRPEPKRIDYRYSPFEVYWVQDEIPYPVAAKDRRYHAKEVVVGVVVDGKARAYLGSKVTAAGGVVQDTFANKRLLIEYSSELSVFRWDVPDEVEVTEAYWFAWKAFHPETEVWSPPGSDQGRKAGEAEPGDR
jgi:hypothetical protein